MMKIIVVNELLRYNTKNDGLRDIVEELHNKEDVFLAPNTMYIPKRRVEN